MVEQIICRHGRQTPGTQSGKYIQRLSRCHIEHNEIYNKYDECRTKVFGYNQDQHMECRQRCRDHNILKFQWQLKTGGNKEYKNNLHKLWRLDICNLCWKAKLCTSGNSTPDNNCRQRKDTDYCVKFSPFCQKLEFPDDHRYNQTACNTCRRDHKLLDRIRIIQPRQHDKSNA